MSERMATLLCVPALIAILSAATVAEDGDRSKVLSLVSLEYRLDGRDYARNHDLLAYAPFLASGDFGVMEVAALSVLWEEFTIVPHKAFKARINAVEGLFGGLKIRPPGVKDDDDQDVEKAIEDAKQRLKGPLQQAIKRGALAAYKGTNILAEMNKGFDEGLKDGMSNIVDKNARYYASQAMLARMQDILWDRAEALARGGAGQAGDSKDLVVSTRIERGRGLVIVAKNRSSRDLHDVTLAALVKKKPIQTPGTDTDLALGALTSRLSGEEDPAKIAQTAGKFAVSTTTYWSLQKRPFRIFLHVPVLPAGKEWSTMLLRSSIELAQSESASFSAWSDELRVEDARIEGFDAQLAQVNKASRRPVNRREPARSPLAVAGPRPARKPAVKAQKPAAEARPIAKAEGPAFEKLKTGTTITLVPQVSGSSRYSFPSCVPAGATYLARDKMIPFDYDPRSPLRAVAASDEAYVAIASDAVKGGTSLVLIPKSQVAHVKD